MNRKEAIAVGATCYQGNPCKRGHNGLRYVSGGKCYQCAIDLSHARPARTTEQRRARRLTRHRYREKEQAHKRAYADKRRAAYEQRQAFTRPMRDARDQVKVLAKQLAKVERALGYNTYGRGISTGRYLKALRTIETIRHTRRESLAARKRNDPEGYREYARNKRRQRAANERANGGSCSPAKMYEILKAQGFMCAYCEETEQLERDHKVSVIDGGSNDCDNMQWLCRWHNNDKGPTPHLLYIALNGIIVL